MDASNGMSGTSNFVSDIVLISLFTLEDVASNCCICSTIWTVRTRQASARVRLFVCSCVINSWVKSASGGVVVEDDLLFGVLVLTVEELLLLLPILYTTTIGGKGGRPRQSKALHTERATE